jgi:hypothetical protein
MPGPQAGQVVAVRPEVQRDLFIPVGAVDPFPDRFAHEHFSGWKAGLASFDIKARLRARNMG